MQTRAAFLIFALAQSASALRVASIRRRGVLTAAAAAATSSLAAAPAHASQMPAHVQDLDFAVSARDPAATAAAMKVLALDYSNPSALWERKDDVDAATHTPTVSSRLASLSAKITFEVAATQSPDDFAKFMWISDAASGKLMAVRELKASEPAVTTASAPKSSTVIASVYFTKSGVWKSKPYSTAEE